MEPEVAGSFSDDILKETTSKYGIAHGHLKLIADSESWVYEFEKTGRWYILKLYHDSHRSIRQIEGELDWIGFLTANNFPAARPIASPGGNYIEVIKGNHCRFYTVVFEKASGRPVESTDWTDDFIGHWGEITGRMHALAKRYRPRDESIRRPEWYKEYNITAADILVDDHPLILEKHKILTEYLRTLPSDNDSYGLIHSDFEDENMFIDNGSVTVFDFDECQYNWFIYDIAVILRESTWRLPACKQADDPCSERFLKIFMQGYNRENRLDPFWMEQLPYFLRLRETAIFVYAFGKCDVSGWSVGDRKALKIMKRRIENEVPCPVIKDMKKLIEQISHSMG